MKIALLSGASSIHTIRWANGLSAAGHDVHVITQHAPCEPLSLGVTVHSFPYRGALGYFIMVPSVRKLLLELKPDIVNAHYASGYATTARLVDYHPWLLSVWGSDVYDFPHKSPLHKWLVKRNLRAADRIASTSFCMADETRKLAPDLMDIAITPFGVDLNAYSDIRPEVPKQKPKLVIGTVKTMSPKYGVDTLIRAYALLLKNLHSKPELNAPELELRLVGGGEQTADLQALAKNLGVASSVTFIGRVQHTQVPQELAKLDIYVALSRLDSESFGVAVIEAGAAGRPVVVSDAGGLPEVTVQDKTGLIVPRESPQAAADAIKRLVLNPKLRQQLGQAGRAHVEKSYNWTACVEKMVSIYNQVITKGIK